MFDDDCTKKLRIICDTASKFPDDIMENVKSFKLDWREISDRYVVLPIITIEMK